MAAVARYVLALYHSTLAQFAAVKNGVTPSLGLLIAIFCLLKVITTTNGILQKVVVSSDEDKTLQLSFYRNLTALPILLLLSRRWEPQAPLIPERRHWAAIFSFSLLAIAGQQTLYLYGLRLSDSYVLGVVFTNLNAVFSALIGRALGLEQLSVLKVAGLVLAVGGTIVMGIKHWPGQPFPSPPPLPPSPPPPLPPNMFAPPLPPASKVKPEDGPPEYYALGVIFLLLSPLSWAVSLYVQKPLLAFYKAPVTFTLWAFTIGTVLNGLLAASLTAHKGAGLWALETMDIVFLVWAATAGTAVKYTLLSWCNLFMDATLLCVLDTLGHAAGVFVGAWVLHEPLHLRYLGAIAVFVGCLAVSISSDWGHGKGAKQRAAEEREAALAAAAGDDEEELLAPADGGKEAGSLTAPLLGDAK